MAILINKIIKMDKLLFPDKYKLIQPAMNFNVLLGTQKQINMVNLSLHTY